MSRRRILDAVRDGWRSREPQHGFFLGSLLALTIAFAILAESPAWRVVIDLLFVLLLLPAIRLILTQRRLRWLGLVLGLLAVVANGLFVAIPDHVTEIARDALTGALLLTATLVILADVLRPGSISWNKIMGAISVYLLIGFCFSFLYGLIDAVQPHAFPIDSSMLSGAPADRTAPFLYYSFVTLTTLGFGDILPVTAAARTATWFEAVTGQLYLTILVARLVGLHIVQSSREDGSG